MNECNTMQLVSSCLKKSSKVYSAQETVNIFFTSHTKDSLNEDLGALQVIPDMGGGQQRKCHMNFFAL